MSSLYNNYIYQPLLHVLVFLYQHFSFHDLGIAIVLLTIIVRIILFPLFHKGAKDQAIMQKIAPKLKEIQIRHKDNKEKQVQETMALYREHKVNPFSQFLLLIIQLPILIALFKIFSKGFQEIQNLHPYFLGFIDLTKPNIIIVLAAAAAQFIQAKLTLPKTDKQSKNLSTAERVSRQMVFIGPIFVVVVFLQFPSALGLYWLTFSVFSVIQQIIINKQLNIEQELKKEGKKMGIE